MQAQLVALRRVVVEIAAFSPAGLVLLRRQHGSYQIIYGVIGIEVDGYRLSLRIDD